MVEPTDKVTTQTIGEGLGAGLGDETAVGDATALGDESDPHPLDTISRNVRKARRWDILAPFAGYFKNILAQLTCEVPQSG